MPWKLEEEDPLPRWHMDCLVKELDKKYLRRQIVLNVMSNVQREKRRIPLLSRLEILVR